MLIKLRSNWSWLWVVYLIFAAYLVVDLAAFQYNPYSGRISSLICAPNQQDQMQCTATLHGWKSQVKHTFLASEFKRVFEIWTFPNATSESMMCGLKIHSAVSTKFFIQERPPCREIQLIRKMIFKHFDEHPSAPYRLIYPAWNLSVYFRLFLLVALPWLICLRKDWLQKKLPTAGQIIGFKQFLVAWLKVNISLKIILFVLSGAWPLLNISHGSFVSFLGPYRDRISLERLCGNCAHPPLVQIIALYPLLAFASIQAIVQYVFLRSKITLSRWWAASPVVSSIALVFGIDPTITCAEMKALQGLPFGWRLGSQSELLGYVVLYALVLGVTQWLLLRKRLSYSWGWVIVLPITLLQASLAFYFWDQWASRGEGFFDIFIFPVLFLAAEVFQAAYLAWVINHPNNQTMLPSP